MIILAMCRANHANVYRQQGRYEQVMNAHAVILTTVNITTLFTQQQTTAYVLLSVEAEAVEAAATTGANHSR